MTPKISVCIPTYNCARIILPTLNNILAQGVDGLEIIISDDCSTDDTVSVIRSVKDRRIRLFQNKTNLGYALNLANFPKLVKSDIIFLMGQDDFIINDGLQKTLRCFDDPSVSVVTRPYYWFSRDPLIPIRHIPPLNPLQDELVNITRQPQTLIPIIESVGQLSGLAYRRHHFTEFDPYVFTAHIHPFFDILTNHKGVFLKDYTIAVSTNTSQTRFLSKIYDISPTKTWMEMFSDVFSRQPDLLNSATRHMAQNYLGLIQIKNHSTFYNLLREIYYLINYYPQNLIRPAFWFYSLGCLVTPGRLLIPLVDWYKERHLSRQLNLPPSTFNV